MNLGLMDAWNLEEFNKIRNKNFTWCRRSPTPIWSCLDRFYVDVSIQQQGGKIGIWSTMAHISDHFINFLQISLKIHKSLIQMKFNLQFLQTKDTKQ